MMEFEKLLAQAKQGEKGAVEKMLEMFQPMLLRNSLVNGRFDEELYQELLLEFFKCIRHFKKLER